MAGGEMVPLGRRPARVRRLAEPTDQLHELLHRFVSCSRARDLAPSQYKLPSAPEFAFLTNHAKALLLIAQDSQIRIRDLAARLQITERATQRFVADLARAGYIDRERRGRRNVYRVRTSLPLGLPLQRDVDIGTLLAVLGAPGDHV
jgi:DNA-binding MarR family transcriptional regulator